MAEPRSPSTNFYNILGISKNASVRDIGKAYKSLVRKWHPDKNPSNRREAETKFAAINEAYKAISGKKQQEKGCEPTTSEGSSHSSRHSNADDSFFSRPSFLSKSSSRKSPTSFQTTSGSTLLRSMSRGNTGPTTPTSNIPTYLSKAASRRSTNTTEAPSLSNISTRRRSTTPIVFSQSTTPKKAQPIEKKLACTLEELSKGCVKKIKITRDVMTRNGIISQEEEILKIKVKPGWRKGTKITFEGKGDEKPGMLPADIIFSIDEKRHPLFKRAGDDLELGVEIPLVQALTGCSISVPLLGGETMCLSFDDIIPPGSEKLIQGQGMPKSKEKGAKGDLRLKFLINFPTELTDEERSEVCSILQDSS